MCKKSVSGIFIVLMAALAAGTAYGGVEFADPAGGWAYIYTGDACATQFDACLDGKWHHYDAAGGGSDAWDGSAPGQMGTAPTPPVPGGAGIFTDAGSTFLRIQDCGDPRDPSTRGWTAEPSNRKITFYHNISSEVPNPTTILNDGVTLSFRARIPTTPPLDPLYPDGGNGPLPWVTSGYNIHDDGLGAFGIKQGASGLGIVSFSLALDGDEGDISGNGLTMNKLNGAAVSANVDSYDSGGTANTLTGFDPTQWHEFWIQIVADTSGGGTHKVTIWRDGSVENPATFHVTAGNKSEGVGGGGWSGYLIMSLGRTNIPGSQDIDFFAYKAGLHAPVPAGSESAYRPSPGNGDDDVDPDVVLSWSPGDFARTHNLYIGQSPQDVLAATIANPGLATVFAGLDANSFDPGRLPLGADFFWRVDEVGAPPASTVYKGDVWSFRTEEVARRITNIQATASSSMSSDKGPGNTVDGSGLTGDEFHGVDEKTMWQSASTGLPATIAFEFDQVYKLYEMKVWNHNTTYESLMGLGAKEVAIEIADSNSGPWTPLADVVLTKALGQADSPPTDTIPMNGAVASNVRLTIRSNHGTAIVMPAAGLAEVQFFCIPVAPRDLTPVDGATVASTDVTLRWRSGREAAKHDVYLDVNDNLALVEGSDPAALVATQAAAGRYGSYTASGLNLGQTYVWKVVEVNTVETPAMHESPVLSFTTPDFRVVDAMESYKNVEFQEIWATWLDGTEFGTKDPTNGSVVGADPATADYGAAAGRTGGQSLPIWFTNTATAPKSEAVRNSPFGDWTQSGIKSLWLWFRGAPANSGNGRLYVKINNGAPIYYTGDPTDLKSAAWRLFPIELSTVGGTLTNVTKLAIGVEGIGATGVVYIDDIGLYPRTATYITPVQPDTANLLAYWDFENNANDRSGHNINGQLVSAQLVTPGKQGMAVQLDGTGHVDLGNPPLLDFGTGDWAVTAWYKTTMASGVATGAIFAKGGDDTGGHRYALLIDEVTDGAVTLTCDDDVTKEQANATTVTNDDQWHFVAGVREGAAIKIYIDGQLEDTEPVDAAYNLSGTSQHKAYIGVITSNNDGSLTKRFSGLIDEVRVYNRALSEAEVLGLAGKTVPVAKPF